MLLYACKQINKYKLVINIFLPTRLLLNFKTSYFSQKIYRYDPHYNKYTTKFTLHTYACKLDLGSNIMLIDFVLMVNNNT